MKISHWLNRSGRWSQSQRLEASRKRRRSVRRRQIWAESLEDRRLLASWSGTLNADTTWANTEVHEITNDVTVAAGATLTIQPGTIVKFHHGNADLFVNGTLDAQGTAGEPIVLTSLKDDVGGDTNGDGGATSPAPGNWARIQVNGTAMISHAQIRYGGFFFGSMVQANGGDLTLSNSVISDSAADGVRVSGSDPTLMNNVYSENFGAAISMDLNSNPAIRGVTVSNNGINGLQVDSGTLGKDLIWDDPDIVYRPDDDVDRSGWRDVANRCGSNRQTGSRECGTDR